MTRRVLILVALLVGPLAWGKSQKRFSYAFDPVWPATIRFLRVDEKLKIVERDPEAGYILFELTDGTRTFRGAAELVRTKDDEGRAATLVILRIDGRPAYMEAAMLERLGKKLLAELGDPPPPPPPEPMPPENPESESR